MSDINITIKLATAQAKQSLDQFGQSANDANRKVDALQVVVRQAQSAFSSFLGNLGSSIVYRAFSGFVNGITNAVNNFKAFETALVGVGKTTNLYGTELAFFGSQIESLSKKIPVASTELLGLAQTAAQLGVTGTDNIIKFTETMARLAVATDVIGESGAIAFARIINVTGESVSNIEKLGSSLVALGNNFAATESQILTVTNEVAKGGARFGITAEQALGLSTAMAALGTEAQVAGSTIQKVFSTVELAIGKGGKSLTKFSSILGISNEELIKLFKNRPDQFFLELVKGLSTSVKAGGNLSSMLADLGFQDLRVTKTLGPLITRTDLLTESLNLSSEAYKANLALRKESDAAFNTLNSDLIKLNNSFISFTNGLIKFVVPAIRLVVNLFAGLFNILNESTFAQTILAGMVTVVFALSVAALQAAGAFALLGKAAGFAWTAVAGPLAPIILGLAAIGISLFLLIKYWDNIYLGILKVTRATLDLVGISTIGLTDEILKLEEKLALNAKLIESTQKKVKAETDLNSALKEQAGIRAFDKQANADDEVAKEQAAAEAIKQIRLDRLATIKSTGDLENELAVGKLELQFRLDGEFTAAEEVKVQQEADRLATKLENEKLFLEQKLFLNDDAAKTQLKMQASQIKRENEIEKAREKAKKEQQAKELKDQETFLTTSATLASSQNKTLAAIGKAAAITQLAIKTPEAVGSSFAFGTTVGGPVTGYAFAAIAAAAMAAQAAKVAGLSFQDGGIVPGSSFSGDKVMANVNSGEMVLNRKQQTQLFNQANGGGSGSSSGQIIEITSIVQIDETEIGRSVSRQVANGLTLGEGGV